MKKDLTYKEGNVILRGYSQTDLDTLIKLLWGLIILLAIFLLFFIYTFYVIDHYNIITKIINRCIC